MKLRNVVESLQCMCSLGQPKLEQVNYFQVQIHLGVRRSYSLTRRAKTGAIRLVSFCRLPRQAFPSSSRNTSRPWTKKQHKAGDDRPRHFSCWRSMVCPNKIGIVFLHQFCKFCIHSTQRSLTQSGGNQARCFNIYPFIR